MDSLNERLAEVQKELDNANEVLLALLDEEEDNEDPEGFQAEVDYLLECINILAKEFESLLQTL